MASQPSSARAPKGPGGDQGVNVQVILRCRPPSKEEIANRTPQVVKCTEAAREVTIFQTQGAKSLGRTYHFDRVFPGETSQEKLYLSAVSPIVDEVLEGFNCTIFAYGQTGTGKTYTMQGGDDNSAELSEAAGVIPRAVHQIFCYLDSINSEYTVKCSFLELYNEEITDLLALGNDTPKVRILEDRSGVVLHGLEEVHVKSASDIFQLLDQGSAKRRTAETLLNKQSSRSHSVFTVTVSIREILAEGEEVIRVGKLYLVDLAGSENISRSGAIDQRAKEAGNINKSLLTLGRVITALVEGQGHVPYRDSKLTRLLRDSLGGKTKTCIIATIAPTVQCQEETLSTLDYAHRAKNIKNKPEVNQKISKTTHLKELNTEIEKLKAELFATREKNGIYLPAKQYEQECEERRQLAARVEFLEQEAERTAEQYESEKQLIVRQAEMQRQQYEGQLKKVHSKLADTQEALRLARVAIEERDFLIAAQQQCEAALADHASGLTAQLHSAAADISLLFHRVDEKNALEDGNLALVQEVKTAAVERLAAIEAAVAALASSQAQRFAESSATLSAFMVRKCSEGERLQQQMAQLQERLAGVGSAAEAAAAALQAAGAAGLQDVDRLHSHYVSVARAATEEAGAAVAAAYASLTASLGEEQQRLAVFTQQQAMAVEAVYGAMQAIVATLREQLLVAKSQADATQADAASRLSKQASAMAEFEEGFLARARTEQAALMEQIAAMLTGFVSKTEKQVKEAVSNLRGRVSEDQAALEAQLAAMGAAAEASLAALQANEAVAQGANVAAGKALQQGSAALGAAMEATSQQGQGLSAVLQQRAAAAAQRLEEHVGAVAAAVQQGVDGVEALCKAEQAKCSAALEKAVEARQAMEVDNAAGYAQDKKVAGELVQLTAGGASQLEGFANEQQAALSGLAAQVRKRIEEEYKMDAGREEVPQQRERPLPAAADVVAMRTPPVEEVLEAFREQKAAAEAEAEQVQEGSEAGSEEAADTDIKQAAASPAEGESQAEGAAPEEQENVDQGNVVAALDVDLPPIKTSNATSPNVAGHKRAREMGTPLSARPTPSKLRGAFERHNERQKQG